MAVILRYFTELVYDVIVKQLPRFQNPLLIVSDHIKTICAIIQRLFGLNKHNNSESRFDGRSHVGAQIIVYVHRLGL